MNTGKNSIGLFLIFHSLILIFLVGCSTVGERGDASSLQPNYGQVSLFLNGPERAAQDITFELTSVNIVSEEGTQMEIMNTPLAVNSVAVTGRQIILGERGIPEGTYKKIKLAVKESSIKKKDRIARLALPPEGIEIDARFTVSINKNTSIFLVWDVDASIADGYLFTPAFNVKRRVPELSALLVYVTNEGSNNVSVINRKSGEVVATVLVGKKPRGIAAGFRKNSLKVYVANSESNSVSVIDPTTNSVDAEIPIRFGYGVEGIAVAKVSSEKELIFVANYSSNTVSVVDGATFGEIEKINVGNGPIALAVDPPVESLQSSRFLGNEKVNILRGYRERFLNVYVANKNSKNISVIVIDLATGRSVDVFSLSVEWSPAALGMDYQRGQVYVANYDSDKLSVIDIVEIVKGRKAQVVGNINNIGNSIISIVADTSFDRIYLLKEVSNELIVIRPFSEGADSFRTTITPVIDAIPMDNSPRSMLLDPEARKLYVVNRGSNNVLVIDKTTRKVEQVIPVGKKPYGITMFNQ